MHRYQQDRSTLPYRRPGHLARATSRRVHHSHPLNEPQSYRQNHQHVHQAHPYRQAGNRNHYELERENEAREHRVHRVQHRPRVQQQQQQCMICSYSQRDGRLRAPVFHRHYSSIRHRELTGVESSGSRHLCPSCKSHHTPYPTPRTKIIVSDSTLHQFFAPPDHAASSKVYEGDLMHVDYITIPGANIDTLTNAYIVDYVDKPHSRPMDVVLVAGYNDLVAGCTNQELMRKFRKFTTTVMHARSSNTAEVNTVAVGDIMYAPQLTWFADNGPLPSNHRGNKLNQIELLNQAILALNLDNGITEYHRLYKYGVRNYTKKHVDEYGQEHHRKIQMHRFQHWREQDPARMLHLSNEQRFKMGAAINNYFVCRT